MLSKPLANQWVRRMLVRFRVSLSLFRHETVKKADAGAAVQRPLTPTDDSETMDTLLRPLRTSEADG
jgi:hypothetical protein